MSDEMVASKIELLEEQIENIERSGFYTEIDMDRLTYPIKQELEALRLQLQNNPYQCIDINPIVYDTDLIPLVNEICVKDAEILNDSIENQFLFTEEKSTDL